MLNTTRFFDYFSKDDKFAKMKSTKKLRKGTLYSSGLQRKTHFTKCGEGGIRY